MTRVLMANYFYPRGGSAHATRALARELRRQGVEVTLVSGSRSDLGDGTDAREFYAGLDPVAVDFAPALSSPQPLRFRGGPGTAPIHGSFEDRPGAPDAVLASLDEEAFELQVEAWQRALAAAESDPEVLYLHHLTPLNEAAARAFAGRPVVAHLHGTELLMMEQVAAGAPVAWAHASAWMERMCRWAAACARIVVADERGRERAAALLGLEPERFACIPSGVDPHFEPGPVDRGAHWRRHLGEEPGGTVLLYVGRFTAVKRLPLLIEAFVRARDRCAAPASLILVGGHPGEWEGEHPEETIARLGARDVFLAGWHPHSALPAFFNAADALVHASPREQFGQVLVEAMACERPPIAVDAAGPASIVADGVTGWLVPPEDADALAAAILAAVEDPAERRRRGRNARAAALERYSCERIGARTAALLAEVN
ncbi:MAG: glycosyltransferase family 4 protein [Solirubrobacterales bacterium]